MTVQFEAGKTYFGRSACDYDGIFQITVAKRTAKTVTTSAGKSHRVSEYCGVEQVRLGSYSMAPIVAADRELVA